MKGTDVTRNGYPNSYRQMIYQIMRIDPRMTPLPARGPRDQGDLGAADGGAK